MKVIWRLTEHRPDGKAKDLYEELGKDACTSEFVFNGDSEAVRLCVPTRKDCKYSGEAFVYHTTARSAGEELVVRVPIDFGASKSSPDLPPSNVDPSSVITEGWVIVDGSPAADANDLSMVVGEFGPRRYGTRNERERGAKRIEQLVEFAHGQVNSEQASECGVPLLDPEWFGKRGASDTAKEHIYALQAWLCGRPPAPHSDGFEPPPAGGSLGQIWQSSRRSSSS